MKSKEQLLLNYKKSNKQARIRIIEKAGYSSEEYYLAYLMSNDEDKETDMLDQVIAFDTTGSMASYLTSVRKHIVELIPRLFNDNPNLKIKVVAFGDYCDMTSRDVFGKAYQETSLTDNQQVLIEFVQNAMATSGGDSDEFYELVIKKITEETPWRKGSKRAVLLISDANPHPVEYYNHRSVAGVTGRAIDWREEARKSSELSIQWDTLSCGRGVVETFYKPLSEMTNGVNMPFSSQEKTADVVFAATSVRGSAASKASYLASVTMAETSGDDELIGTYKALRKKL